jgi:hypothetical protein
MPDELVLTLILYKKLLRMVRLEELVVEKDPSIRQRSIRILLTLLILRKPVRLQCNTLPFALTLLMITLVSLPVRGEYWVLGELPRKSPMLIMVSRFVRVMEP